MQQRGWIGVLATIAVWAAAGCDPVVNIAGADFPAWLLSALLGAALALGFRAIFVFTGIDRDIGPAFLIYPSLAFLLGCIIYLTLFDRVG